MIELAIDVVVYFLVLGGLFLLLSSLTKRPEPLCGQPPPSPPTPFPLSLETAERMIERAYDRSASRRTSGGEAHHPRSRENAD